MQFDLNERIIIMAAFLGLDTRFSHLKKHWHYKLIQGYMWISLDM